MDILTGREIIFEFKASGGYCQVCAIDCATGIEAVVTTPRQAARIDQQNLALRRLAKTLTDQGVISVLLPANSEKIKEKGDTLSRVPPSSKRGFLT